MRDDTNDGRAVLLRHMTYSIAHHDGVHEARHWSLATATESPTHLAIPLTALTPDAIPAAVVEVLSADWGVVIDDDIERTVRIILTAALISWPRTDDTMEVTHE